MACPFLSQYGERVDGGGGVERRVEEVWEERKGEREESEVGV